MGTSYLTRYNKSLLPDVLMNSVYSATFRIKLTITYKTIQISRLF